MTENNTRPRPADFHAAPKSLQLPVALWFADWWNIVTTDERARLILTPDMVEAKVAELLDEQCEAWSNE